MKKKGLALLVALMLVFGLVACKEKTTTTTTAATTTTTAFKISLSGLTDAGFTEEDKIIAGEWFDLLAGVSAMGSDSVNYISQVQVDSDDDACQIEDGKLMATGPKTCVINYSIVVQGKIARGNRTIKISNAPVVTEFTPTTKWNNETILGTDYVVTDTQGAVNTFYYWAANAGVLGETGVIEIASDKLIIDQETLGGVNFGFQAMMLTNITLEAKRTYKLSFTLTSETARYIDVVMKAPNNDYDNDTHSIIEVMEGTHDYEAIFVAPQTTLHINIMTGVVEGSVNAGRLEFSNFVLYEGPIELEYEELTDFFKNDAITVGTQMEYITGTDTDYVREFYYWDQASGALLEGEYVEGGFELTVVTQASDTWGAQLQWNDLTKAGTQLKKGANYKLSFTLTATAARMINLQVTGPTNGDAISKEQMYELNVGANEIVLEFNSKYSTFFMKVHFGNYGDLTQTGTFTFTDMKLFEEEGAVEEPEEPVVSDTSYGIFNGDFNAEGFALNAEGSAWTTWTNANEASFAVVDGAVVATINAVGTEVFHAQLGYRPATDDVIVGNTYVVEFDVNATVAGTFSMEMTTTGNAANVQIPVTLVVGDNHVSVEYVAHEVNFKLTACIGTYGLAILTFDNFVAYEKVDKGILNGSFEPNAIELNGEGSVWSTWTNANEATFAVVDEAVVATITGVGTEVWHAQLSYRPITNDVVVGSTYVVEFDVNATVAGTFSMEMTTTGNAANVQIPVTLVVGDNHVTLQYVAYEENFKLTACIGTYGVAVLTFDNFTANLLDGADIFNYDFSPMPVALNAAGSGWTSWTNANEATFAVVDEAVVATITVLGTEVWHAQLGYRPTSNDVVVGDTYRVEFDVYATVAGTFSMEMSTTNNAANVAIPVTLVVGNNHVVVEYVAYETNFKLTACIGTYGIGVLTFDNFEVFHLLSPYTEPAPAWTGYGMEAVVTGQSVTATYTTTPTEWWSNNLQSPIADFDGTKTSILFTFTGVAGTEYMFKIEGNGKFVETPVVATGASQELVLDLSTLTEAERDGLNLIIVFVKTVDASGTLTIEGWEYVIPSWTGYGMEAVITGNAVTATYTTTPTEWWSNNLQSSIAAFDGSKSSIIFTYTGVAGTEYMFKIEGGGKFVELASVATGASQEVTLDLSSLTKVERDALNLIIVFVKTVGAAGTITVEGWRYVIPAWTGYGMEAVVTGQSVTATYTATPTSWWSNNLQSPIADFDGTKTGIVFTYTGVEGVTYLFKIEGNGQNLELPSIATGSSQTVTLDLSAMTEAQRDGLNLIVVFVQTVGAAGTFTVTGWDYVQ